MSSKTTENITEQIYQIIRETLNIDPKEVDPQTPWYDLGAESFDMVELIISLRDHFRLNLQTTDLDKVKTLQELIDFIEVRQLMKR